MIKKKILGIVLLTVFLSCNVQNIRRARLNNDSIEKSASAQVDSFLYYQPVPLNNSFLDSLAIENDNELTFKVRIVPPPPLPDPLYKQIDGYRVQTFAGLDSINGVLAAKDARKTLEDTVYFFKEKGLFKIQIGDYLYRNDADLKVLDLRKNGISNGWVVRRLINVPFDSTRQLDVAKLDTVPIVNKPFTIQILVTSNLQNAQSTIAQLESQFQTKAYYVQKEQLYKIFIGEFETREQAEKFLNKVRSNGYKDAWLVKN